MKGITVTGVGTVSAAPDIASVEIGAEVLAGTAAEARASVAELAARIIEALKSRGVPGSDIQSSRFSIQPQHDYGSGQPRLTGYLASNMFRVTLRNTESVGETLDAALQAAGDAGRLHGLSFQFSDPAKLAIEARTRAVEAAKQNAETLAKASGVKLGRVTAISEAGGAPEPRPRMMAMAMESAKGSAIEAGESAVSVSVVVRFAIKS